MVVGAVAVVNTTDAPSTNGGNASTPTPTTPGSITAAPVGGTPAPSTTEGNVTGAPSPGAVTMAPVAMTSAPTGSPSINPVAGLIGATVGDSPCLNQRTFATEEEALEASDFCNCTGIHSVGDMGYMIGRTHGQCTPETVGIAPKGEVRMEVVDETTAALSGTVSGLQQDCTDGVLTINSGFSCNEVLGFDSPGETLFTTFYSTNSAGETTIDMKVTAADLGFTGPKNIRYLVGLTLSMFGCGVEFPPTAMPTSAPSLSPTVNDTTARPTISPTVNVTQAPTVPPTANVTTTMPPSSTDVNTTAPSAAPTVAVTNGTVTTAAPSMPPTTNSSESTPAPTVESSGNVSDVNATRRILQDNNATSAPTVPEETESNTTDTNGTTTMAPTPMGSVEPTMEGNKTDGPKFFPRIACARFFPDAPEISGQTFGDVVPPGFPNDVISTPFAMLEEMDDSSINGTANVNFKSLADSIFNYTLVFSAPVTAAPTSPPTNATTTSAPSMTPMANTSAPTTALTSAPTNTSTNATDEGEADNRRVLAEGGVKGFMSVREGTCDDLGAFFETNVEEGANGTFWMEAFPFELSAEKPMVSVAQSLSQFAQAVLNQSDYEGLPVVASDESGDGIFACGILETPPLVRGMIYAYPAQTETSRRLAKDNTTETFDVIGQFSGLPDGATVTIGDEQVTLEGEGDAQFFAPQTVVSTLAELKAQPFVIKDAEGNTISEGDLGGSEITVPPTIPPTPSVGTPAPTPTTGAPTDDNSLALGLGLGLGLGIPLLLALIAFTMRSGGGGGDAKEPEKGAYQGQQQTGGETAGTTTQQSSFTQGVQQA